MALTAVTKVGAGALAAVAGAALTLVFVDPTVATPPPVAQAWIDEPLHGSTHPEGEIELTAHATDPDGVAEVRLTIDGDEVHVEVASGEDELVTVETTWEPPGPGTYELAAVAEDEGGHAGAGATATFTVGDPGAPTTTSTTAPGDPTTTSTSAPGDPTTTETTEPGETTTTGSTGTTRPPATTTTRPPTTTTAAPCRPSVPRLVSPGDDQAVPTRTPRLTWSYSGCGPSSFTVQVSSNDQFLSARGVYLHSVTVDGAAGNVIWPQALQCETHYWRVRATAAGGTSAWSTVRSVLIDPPDGC